jgi:hypothetical protein
MVGPRSVARPGLYVAARPGPTHSVRSGTGLGCGTGQPRKQPSSAPRDAGAPMQLTGPRKTATCSESRIGRAPKTRGQQRPRLGDVAIRGSVYTNTWRGWRTLLFPRDCSYSPTILFSSMPLDDLFYRPPLRRCCWLSAARGQCVMNVCIDRDQALFLQGFCKQYR